MAAIAGEEEAFQWVEYDVNYFEQSCPRSEGHGRPLQGYPGMVAQSKATMRRFGHTISTNTSVSFGTESWAAGFFFRCLSLVKFFSAYDPNNENYRKLSGWFWEQCTTYGGLWRDQHMWAYALHHFNCTPAVMTTKGTITKGGSISNWREDRMGSACLCCRQWQRCIGMKCSHAQQT
jgi:hypothetical protein